MNNEKSNYGAGGFCNIHTLIREDLPKVKVLSEETHLGQQCFRHIELMLIMLINRAQTLNMKNFDESQITALCLCGHKRALK